MSNQMSIFDLGIEKPSYWAIDIDNDMQMLRCESCGGRVIRKWYDRAVGNKGFQYCPYCGKRMENCARFIVPWPGYKEKAPNKAKRTPIKRGEHGYSAGYADDWDGGQSDIPEEPEVNAGSEGLAEDVWSEDTGLTYLGEYTISFYCPCEICCGEGATGYTASGVPATAWHTVASGQFEFGTELYIDGLGYFVVEDRGVDGNWIDVFCGNHDEALALGLQNRGVYLVG